jgi:hypothetical protein
MGDKTEPDEATLEAERAEAAQAHSADRQPTTEEESAAEKSRKEFAGDSEDVAAHYEEMNDIGSHVKGEGTID